MSAAQFENQKAKFSLAKTFGLDVPESKYTVGFKDHTHPNIPLKIPGYVHQENFIWECNLFHLKPRRGGMYIGGERGTGKTTAIEQFAHALNIPCLTFSGYEGSAVAELEGTHMVLTDAESQQPTSQVVMGMLYRAYKYGYWFICDEIDRMPPGQSIKFNPALERKALTVELTGEVIHPHPDFRFFATGNTFGKGDNSGQYVSAFVMDAAVRDRFRLYDMEMPTEKEEVAILRREVPELTRFMNGSTVVESDVVIEGIARIAAGIRKVFKNPTDEVALSDVMSLRTTLMWAGLLVDMRGRQNCFQASLAAAFTRRLETPWEKEFVTRLAIDTFGQDRWENGFKVITTQEEAA